LTAITHEHNWITKDGSSQSIAWDYTPCLDSDGAIKYVIGIGKASLQKRKQKLQPSSGQPNWKKKIACC